MPQLSLLIKPASGNCNLRCKYCFYHDVTNHREIKSYGIMSENTLELLVKRAFDFAEHRVTFAFQGGEPTLAGLDFYKKFTELQKEYNIHNIEVNNALQTNGMVITEEWAKYFKDNNYLIGLSLDGYKDIHDSHRIDSANKGSYNRVLKTSKLFDQYKVEYNILSVVNKNVAKHGSKIYNFFKKQGFHYLQFIPCLDALGKAPGQNPYSLTPEDYETFLKTIFNLWYHDFKSGHRVSVRMFDNILQMILGYPPESCDMVGRCSANGIVEADGSIYPCDFYVVDKWKLGNIFESDIKSMLTCEVAQEFVRQSIDTDPACRECEYFQICRGGCRRHKEPFENGKFKSNYFCSTYKGFYEYAMPMFIEIARTL